MASIINAQGANHMSRKIFSEANMDGTKDENPIALPNGIITDNEDDNYTVPWQTQKLQTQHWFMSVNPKSHLTTTMLMPTDFSLNRPPISASEGGGMPSTKNVMTNVI